MSPNNTSLWPSMGIRNTNVSRTLVLCFDGTGDEFNSNNSNVVKFFSLLKRDDPRKQVVYYQSGFGTYTSKQLVTSIGNMISKIFDQAVAWNLSSHVMTGYEFLMQTYQEGDKICLFGFSRGAYTARALAGMLYKVGLLPLQNHQQIPFAHKMYKRTDTDGWKESLAFKKAFSIDVKIEFIGVWDTVCSVGIIPRQLPFVRNNTAIRTFRHAISLDERRAMFSVNHCHKLVPANDAGTGSQSQQQNTQTKSRRSRLRAYMNDLFTRKENERVTVGEANFRTAEKDCGVRTSAKEVWFAGCHSDVGGGSVKNDKKRSLAHISLRWMVWECFHANTGIQFHEDLLKEIGLNRAGNPFPATTPENEAHNEPDNTKKTEELDETSSIHDQLSRKISKWWWGWWIIEVLYLLHMGEGRTALTDASEPHILVHSSVRLRIEKQTKDSKGRLYKPRLANWEELLKSKSIQYYG